MYLLRSKIKKPFVTIVIPTYKRLPLLKETLDSCINIDHEFEGFVELIVVDNNPVDLNEYQETLQVLESYDKDYISYWVNNENLGMFGNWNQGIQLSTSEWVTILHDDDLVLPGFIKRFVSNVNDECMDLLAFQNEIFYQGEAPSLSYRSSEKQNPTIQISPYDYFIKNPHLGTLGIFFNKNKLYNSESLTWFNDQYGPSSDYAFFALWSVSKRFYLCDAVTSLYRIESNTSLKRDTMKEFIENDRFIKLELLDKMGMTNSWLKMFIPFGKYSQLYKFKTLSKDNLIRKEDIVYLENKFNIYQSLYPLFRVVNRVLWELLKRKRFKRNDQ